MFRSLDVLIRVGGRRVRYQVGSSGPHDLPEDPEAVAVPGDAGVLRYDESQGLGAPPAAEH